MKKKQPKSTSRSRSPRRPVAAAHTAVVSEPVVVPEAEPALPPVQAAPGPTSAVAATLAPAAEARPSHNESPGVPSEVDDDAGLRRRPLREAIGAAEGRSDTLVFHIGRERFAIDLASVDEAIELPSVHHLPEMPADMLGVFELRGRLVPVYSPVRVLRVPLARQAAAVLVLRWGDKRLGLAVDDVDDVLTVDARAVRRAPIADNENNVLLGVIRRDADLLALVDAEALAQACLIDHLPEAA